MARKVSSGRYQLPWLHLSWSLVRPTIVRTSDPNPIPNATRRKPYRLTRGKFAYIRRSSPAEARLPKQVRRHGTAELSNHMKLSMTYLWIRLFA